MVGCPPKLLPSSAGDAFLGATALAEDGVYTKCTIVTIYYMS